MQGGRILIVDDEPMVRETIAQVLRDEGYTVEVADDGRDALIKLDAHRPDAVLLDLMMPGMNGRQFLTALREDRNDQALPVVVMTAVHGVGERALSLGATDIVEKPFDVDDLLGKIALAVYRSREHGDGRSGDFAPAAPPPTTDTTASPTAETEKGVVFLIHHDRDALQRLDQMLSSRGYAVVSMARITPQLPRLARVLAPRAILLDLDCPGGGLDIVATLRSEATLDSVPILLFSRADATALDDTGDDPALTVASRPVDEDLVRFLEGPDPDADISRH
ncbi:MAG TPA: response regulator [Kofleriaceae bacterium]|jgi:DNA-binding response OmpR family regulator|nr:response regulator [Kofleriaceae bacterium]